jgi:hypothetical protein
MGSDLHQPPHREVNLTSSAPWVPSGYSVSLSWEVLGVDELLPNVQLAWAGESGLEVIEAVPERGSRQIIFTRAGIYTFTLTAAFGDGVKLIKQAHIQVGSSFEYGE